MRVEVTVPSGRLLSSPQSVPSGMEPEMGSGRSNICSNSSSKPLTTLGVNPSDASTVEPMSGSPGASVPITPALVTLHVWGVPTGQVPAAMTRVARDRLALRGYPGLTFAKLLGTGNGHTFAPQDADPHHWALLTCWDAPHAAKTLEYSRVIRRWDAAAAERVRISMTPQQSKGQWSGRQPFGSKQRAVQNPDPGELVAGITRARIRWRQLPAFWKTLPSVVSPLPTQPGLIWSLGIGEAPIGLQGTFSLWRDVEAMHQFAHDTPGHREAIQQTRRTGWYSEELFARLRVVDVNGTFNGMPMMS